jgi:hypothetical protein
MPIGETRCIACSTNTGVEGSKVSRMLAMTIAGYRPAGPN